MRGIDLIAIGEGMVEFQADDGSARAGTYRRGFAGDVVNTLVNGARLGLRVALVSRIGDDAFAPALVAAWRSEGLDLRHAPVVPGENGLYFVFTDDAGERRFAYRRAGSAASRLLPDDIDADFLRAARMVLLSGITQAISDTAADAVARAAVLARVAAYDPNHRPSLWSARGADPATGLRAVAPRMRWLLPSWPADLAALDIGDAVPPGEAARRFAALAPDGGVALKLGAEGVLVRQGGDERHVPATPVAAVVDTTGAGDAWNARFLAGVIRGEAPVDAAAVANRWAARVLAHRGAIPPRAPDDAAFVPSPGVAS